MIDRLQNTPSDNFHDRYYYDDESGLLYLIASPSNHLCIPWGDLHLALLQKYHDCITAAHPSRDRTYFRLSRFFYWHRMGIDVKRFVMSCDRCQRAKAGQVKSGLLQPLSVPARPWEDISMDFVMGLPFTPRGHDAIYTFVDRLTNCIHLVPTVSTVDAEASVDLYIQNVFRLPGLSSSNVCDRDPRFTSAFFQDLFKKLSTNLSFSTANHPQTGGQSERVNRIISDVLRVFANHKKDDWDLLLPFCEFSINNSEHSSTCETPFFLNYGLNPRVPADFLSPSSGEPCHDWLQAQAESFRMAQEAIVAAQPRQAFYADQKKTPEDLSVGDSVMVHRESLLTPEARSRPSHKLQLKWYGPFKVLQRVGPNAYRLELLHSVRCHPVFNVLALKKYNQNSIAGRVQSPPPPITDLDGHERFIVDSGLDHRVCRGQLQFLVRWRGYHDATWEPANYLLDESGEDIISLQRYKSHVGLH